MQVQRGQNNNSNNGELSPFGVGSGTQSDPYQIRTVDDFLYIPMVDGSNVYFKLAKNIDLSTTSYTPIPEFWGILDGSYNTISNFGLYVNPNQPNQGLFGENRGTVKNMSLNGFLYTGGFTMNGMVAGINYGTIQSVSVTAYLYVAGGLPYVGIITGYNYGTVDNCSSIPTDYNPGTYMLYNPSTTGVCTGGIAGYNTSSGTIKNCANAGIVYSVAYGRGEIYGLNDGYVTNNLQLGGVLP